jgi:twitching motility protein PilT
VKTINLEAISPWLQLLWDEGGSDLLLTNDSAPRLRVDGKLRPIESAAKMSGEEVDEIVRSLLDPSQVEIFEDRQDVDFSFSWQDKARLRASAFTQKGHTALALRMIPTEIPSFDQLGLPPVADWLATLPRGLVLVTGPTGSGKSTTLAAIIDRINETRSVHVLTIEDPIEYLHDHKIAAVTQREIGLDSPSFDRALRSALREDPDVLLVGEMRDTESIQIALTMAETGHLVFSTLHTNDAAQAVDRMIDVFPDWRQDQIRVQLSASLGAIVAQRLLPRIGGGRVAAFEVLVANHPVRNLIREGKSNQLMNIMATNQGAGMQTLELNLAMLISSDTITYNDALEVSVHPKELDRSLNRQVLRAAEQVSADKSSGSRAATALGDAVNATAEQPVVVGRSD